MRKRIACIICAGAIGLMIGPDAYGKEVTTLELDCGNCHTEEIQEIQGVAETEEPEAEEPETTEPEAEETTETFTGNYGSSDEGEWVDIDPEDCPEHIWEYSYDDDESGIGEDGDIIYFRFCLNCGYTEILDECPQELEYIMEPAEDETEEENEDTEI